MCIYKSLLEEKFTWQEMIGSIISIIFLAWLVVMSLGFVHFVKGWLGSGDKETQTELTLSASTLDTTALKCDDKGFVYADVNGHKTFLKENHLFVLCKP